MFECIPLTNVLLNVPEFHVDASPEVSDEILNKRILKLIRKNLKRKIQGIILCGFNGESPLTTGRTFGVLASKITLLDLSNNHPIFYALKGQGDSVSAKPQLAVYDRTLLEEIEPNSQWYTIKDEGALIAIFHLYTLE